MTHVVEKEGEMTRGTVKNVEKNLNARLDEQDEKLDLLVAATTKGQGNDAEASILSVEHRQRNIL